MGDQTKGGITWTERTWNPIRGCRRVSDECRNCYAEIQAARWSGPGQPYDGLAENTPSGPRWTGAIRMVDPLEKQCNGPRQPRVARARNKVFERANPHPPD